MRTGLKTGHNVDPVDIAAGMTTLTACGYDEPKTREVIKYALQRWARGEEEAAQRGAIDPNFHGITLTCWYRVLAAAIETGKAKLERAESGVTEEAPTDDGGEHRRQNRMLVAALKTLAKDIRSEYQRMTDGGKVDLEVVDAWASLIDLAMFNVKNKPKPQEDDT